VEAYRIAVRAAVAYAVLLALLRASGKRTVATGRPFDFVLALILGDMVDDLLWAEVSGARFLAAVGTLTLVHTLVAIACGRSERLGRWLSGMPVRVLEHGRPRPRGLRAEHISEPELERMLRVQQVPRERWSEVRVATVELSGEAAVLPEPWAEPLRKRDVAPARPPEP
jgi:uncharacterized membrane protein YcaP (DUF421 family)